MGTKASTRRLWSAWLALAGCTGASAEGPAGSSSEGEAGASVSSGPAEGGVTSSSSGALDGTEGSTSTSGTTGHGSDSSSTTGASSGSGSSSTGSPTSESTTGLDPHVACMEDCAVQVACTELWTTEQDCVDACEANLVEAELFGIACHDAWVDLYACLGTLTCEEFVEWASPTQFPYPCLSEDEVLGFECNGQ